MIEKKITHFFFNLGPTSKNKTLKRFDVKNIRRTSPAANYQLHRIHLSNDWGSLEASKQHAKEHIRANSMLEKRRK